MKILTFLLIGHSILLYTTLFTLWPEMVVYPYLLNNGFSLYRDIINPYTPLFTYALSVLTSFFGYNPQTFKVLTIALILLVDFSIFFVAKKISKSFKKALISLAFFIVFSIPFGVDGLWFDLVQTTPIIFSAYFFYLFQKKKTQTSHLVISGTLLAVAIFIKQQAFWLSFWYLFIIFISTEKKHKLLLKRFSFLLVPTVLAAALALSLSYFLGIHKEFIFWTLYFPAIVASNMPGYLLFPSSRQIVALFALLLLFFPLLTAKRLKENYFFLTGIVLFSFAFPRFDYFHLIPSLALLSISLPKNIEMFKKAQLPAKAITMLGIGLLILFAARSYSKGFTQEIRFFEPEVYRAANIIRATTQEGESVYIQNGPDQTFVIANSLPPKPWADEFPWYLEIKGLQEQVISGLLEENTEFIIYKPYEEKGEFEIGSYRPKIVAGYIDRNYENLFQISDSLWLKRLKKDEK